MCDFNWSDSGAFAVDIFQTSANIPRINFIGNYHNFKLQILQIPVK